MEGRSSSRMSKNSSATRQASGPPPYVEPCIPGLIVAAAFSFAMTTPTAVPQPVTFAAVLVAMRADHLERTFHGFRAGVAEEGSVQTAYLGEPFGKASLVLVIVEV